MSTLIESDDDLSANDLALSYQDTIGGPIRALRAIVAQFGYINDNHISNVADVFNLSRAEVRGIVSFYADLRTSPPAKHKVRICQGEACQSVGSRALTADFMVKSQVLNQSKAPDYVEHEPVVCLGLCPRGPVAMINDEPAPLTWAQRLKRVFELDITLCPLCGGQLRVIADITDPDLIRKILDHVQKRAPPGLPPRRAPSDTTYPDLFAKRQ